MATKLQPIQVNMVELLKLVYPVGSVYINASVDTNPATLLGFGTWTAFGAGRVMVGQDTSDVQFDVLEETGGAKTHTLTASESGLPAHGHTVNNGASQIAWVTSGGDGHYQTPGTSTKGYVISVNNNSAANASSAHNNLQPYIIVKMWKRTA